MPLGLYTPFVDGLGHLDMGVILPGALGAIVTVIAFAKAIDLLFKRYYSVAFHAIVGIVIAATIMTVPYAGFAVSAGACAVNIVRSFQSVSIQKEGHAGLPFFIWAQRMCRRCEVLHRVHTDFRCVWWKKTPELFMMELKGGDAKWHL